MDLTVKREKDVLDNTICQCDNCDVYFVHTMWSMLTVSQN